MGLMYPEEDCYCTFVTLIIGSVKNSGVTFVKAVFCNNLNFDVLSSVIQITIF